MEPEDTGEIALHVEGESAIAVGDPAALAALFERLDVDPTAAVPVGQAIADTAAAVSGLGAVGMTAKGNWFQMTPESLAKFQEFSSFNPPANGVFSAAIRGEGGRFETFVDLVQANGINPASVANAHALAAAMALRMAIKNLEDLVKRLDVKLDRVLQDSRTREMGNVQGITHVLSKIYRDFEETGTITATDWGQIDSHPTELAQLLNTALGHIDTLTQGLSAEPLKKKLESAELASNGELQHWLVLAAICLANMARMDALEIAHARTQDEASAVRQAAKVKRANEDLLAKTKETVQALANAAESAGRVEAFHRVASPFAATRLEKSTEKIRALLSAFSDAFGMPAISQHTDRRAWHESILDLAQEVSGGVVGAATAVTTGVAAAPKAIGTAVEDSFLGFADQIRSRRESETEHSTQESDAKSELMKSADQPNGA
ncbi:hypothetical protein ACHMXB_22190 (plasmid) [Arthrobacter sp. UC242_113]|uniref:hypothetical protein n=1 Tax=Arthrobacter sp. UC242_113 TaxID=3374550 RepID=UPI00375645FD